MNPLTIRKDYESDRETDDIKSAINYESFFHQELPDLKGHGDNLHCNCPLCGDKGGHFYVNKKTGLWDCKKCEEKGDVFTFVMMNDGVDFPEAKKTLVDYIGVSGKLKDAPTIEENIEARYHYTSETGKLLFDVIRFEKIGFKKTFRQWQWSETTKSFIQNLNGARLVPYRLPEVLRAETVYLVEGEKDVESLRAMDAALAFTEVGKLAVAYSCNPMGAGKWRDEYTPHFKGRHVVILPDNDTKGRDHGQKVAKALHGAAASVKVVNLPGLSEKGDVTDWLDAGGTLDQLEQLVGKAPAWTPGTTADGKNPAAGIVSASDLLRMDIPELRWAVPGFLPEGLTVLAGNPKVKKSWLALGAMLAIGAGLPVLGKFETTPARCLYLALEDSRRRLQDRIHKIMDPQPDLAVGLDNVMAVTEWPTMDEGGLEALDAYAEANPDLKLIVIDTLVKMRPKTRPKGFNAYEVDSMHLAEIKKLADRRHLGVVVITHLNKGKTTDKGDPFDRITGSNGIFGVADTAMLLTGERDAKTAELRITGRDVESQDYAVEWADFICSWSITGKAIEVKLTGERQSIMEMMKAADRPVKTAEVARYLKKTSASVSYLLGKMLKDGCVESPGYGLYSLIDNP
ncbi:AAA family ATPase [Solidesulfovibrio alcoholivorans]|uniref:AAA family ATPase n=1 Tax=Solidesulfovibrio alcoholivorans TaxID=81406 RepID=UPI0006944B62|nr:AAA family ATPase [Solidesulfovibrio alcoholivorans]